MLFEARSHRIEDSLKHCIYWGDCISVSTSDYARLVIACWPRAELAQVVCLVAQWNMKSLLRLRGRQILSVEHIVEIC